MAMNSYSTDFPDTAQTPVMFFISSSEIPCPSRASDGSAAPQRTLPGARFRLAWRGGAPFVPWRVRCL